jgi:hypothetical protein
MKILILGALPKDEEKKKLYESIIDVCKDFVEEISSPIDTIEFQGSDSERYERAFQKVKEADLIIGEQSEPSTGQGMETREAAVLNKPLVVIAKTGSKISGLIKGCPVLKEIIYYDDIEDLKAKLLDFLENWRK